MGHETTYGRKLYEYQSAAMRIGIAFLLPLLFAAEIEVTPVLRALPELRFLVTKGPMYLLIGTSLLISADSWPAYEFINDTAYICLVCLYIGNNYCLQQTRRERKIHVSLNVFSSRCPLTPRNAYESQGKLLICLIFSISHYCMVLITYLT